MTVRQARRNFRFRAVSAPRRIAWGRTGFRPLLPFKISSVNGREAQTAVIGRRSAERIEPIESLPFEYLLGGGIL